MKASKQNLMVIRHWHSDQDEERMHKPWRRDQDGNFIHCDEPMAACSYGDDDVVFYCEKCHYDVTFKTDDDDDPIFAGDLATTDAFQQDDPYLALSPYQKYKLNQIWTRDRFGSPYRRGLWSKCGVRDQIDEWYQLEDRGFGLSGDVGVGKTISLALMMTCLASRNEFSFCYENSAELFDFLHRYDSHNKAPKLEWDKYALANNRYELNSKPSGSDERTLHQLDAERYERLVQSRFLFLDDVGTEYAADWNLSRFTMLMEKRYGSQRRFIITSNLSPKSLRDREGWERIISRWSQYMTNWYSYGGEDKRVIKSPTK